ncbi:MAG: radical SAM protein [Chromatiales bacterium]
MTETLKSLTFEDHSRGAAGLRYVYPVVSRRAGGVSVGVNLNTNNACNWRCVYCQVPDLLRGDAPPVDLTLLRRELTGFLTELQEGTFMRDRVPEEARRIVDVALSGNGEPTTAREFPLVIAVIEEVLREQDLLGRLVLRLITNGSRIGRAPVAESLRRMAECSGEVWFKLDAGSPSVLARINGVSLSAQTVTRNLRRCAELCPTWVQTCAFAWNDRVPLKDDLQRYLSVLRDAGVEKLRGVHLYGLARPSMQTEAPELRRLSAAELEELADTVRALGLIVQVNP